MALIDNNGYWYEVWLEPGRKQKKRAVKDASNKTLKIIYNKEGKPTNRDQAVIMLNQRNTSSDEVPVNGRITIDEGWKLAKEYFINNAELKGKTINDYHRCIEIAKKYLPNYVQDIKKQNIVNFVNVVRGIKIEQIKPVSKQRYVKALSSFFVALVERGYLAANPVRGYKFKNIVTIVEPFEELQILKLLEIAKALEEKIGLPYYKFLMFAFQTGLRLSEYANLRWKNLNWQNQEYEIFKDSTFDPKFGKRRAVYIPKLSFNLLKQMPKDDSEYVWHKPNGSRWNDHLNRDFLSDIFKVAELKLTEYQHQDLHQIRKTHSSFRLACGQPIQNLALELGHSSPNTLFKHYVGRVSNPSARMKEIFGDYR